MTRADHAHRREAPTLSLRAAGGRAPPHRRRARRARRRSHRRRCRDKLRVQAAAQTCTAAAPRVVQLRRRRQASHSRRSPRARRREAARREACSARGAAWPRTSGQRAGCRRAPHRARPQAYKVCSSTALLARGARSRSCRPPPCAPWRAVSRRTAARSRPACPALAPRRTLTCVSGRACAGGAPRRPRRPSTSRRRPSAARWPMHTCYVRRAWASSEPASAARVACPSLARSQDCACFPMFGSARRAGWCVCVRQGVGRGLLFLRYDFAILNRYLS